MRDEVVLQIHQCTLNDMDAYTFTGQNYTAVSCLVKEHTIIQNNALWSELSWCALQVMEAAVIAVPHPKWTERPLLVVVSAPNSNLSKDDMLSFLQARFDAVADYFAQNRIFRGCKQNNF